VSSLDRYAAGALWLGGAPRFAVRWVLDQGDTPSLCGVRRRPAQLDAAEERDGVGAR